MEQESLATPPSLTQLQWALRVLSLTAAIDNFPNADKNLISQAIAGDEQALLLVKARWSEFDFGD